MPSPALDNVVADITAANTTIDGAIVYIAAVPKLITDAVSAAVANGASADELKPVSDLADTLKAKAADMANAMAANTPSPAPTPQQLKKAKS